jgi:hypothetical protein
MEAFANGSATPILTNGFLSDTGFVDISSFLAAGVNTLTLRLSNTSSGYTYGYQLRRDLAIIDEATCGTVNVAGCNSNDEAPGNVFTHTVTFGLAGAPNSLRLFNRDDRLQAFVTNSAHSLHQILFNDFQQDTGIVDISSLTTSGENRIDLVLTNGIGGYTYGFEFRNGFEIVDAGMCGTVNVAGCNDNNFAEGTVYTHALLFSIPEPGSLLLLAAGLGLLFVPGAARKRRHSQLR